VHRKLQFVRISVFGGFEEERCGNIRALCSIGERYLQGNQNERGWRRIYLAYAMLIGLLLGPAHRRFVEFFTVILLPQRSLLRSHNLRD
jgi:hypothetical protein